MRVWKNFPKLETGSYGDIVIRNITEPFWKACIDTVNTPGRRIRVCAVGTPGIGKTTCTPYLIRMLLKKNGDTVVYLLRKNNEKGRYYQFVKQEDGTITARIYPEEKDIDSIPVLKKESTYYIIDPRKTTDSCDPGDEFEGKVIIPSSPNSRHWGNQEFTKNRDGVFGVFHFFPLWTLDELQHARPYITTTEMPPLTPEDVEQRFGEVGGVPRHIFADPVYYARCLELQDSAVQQLTFEQAEDIARDEIRELDAMNSKVPKSAIMGYTVKPGDSKFQQKEIVLVSPRAGEKVYSKFMKLLWKLMLKLQIKGDMIFEAYTRAKMAERTKTEYEARFFCYGCKEPDPNVTKTPPLGGCTATRYSANIIGRALNEPNVVFHSVRSNEALVDFVYYDKSEWHFHLFQATTSETHDININQAKNISTRLLQSNKVRNVSLYYLVPGDNYPNYRTKRKNLGELWSKSNAAFFSNWRMWEVLVPNPDGEMSQSTISQKDGKPPGSDIEFISSPERGSIESSGNAL
jgi:hypothetical protein